ncbi:DUF4376 domain-containing protein [Amorphus sp. MBR-141]
MVETTTVDPAGRFAPGLDWRAAPEGVAVGWQVDGETFGAPAGPSLADLKAAKADLVDARRDTVLTGGYQHNFGGSAGVRTLDNRSERDAINWLGLKGLADAMITAGDGDDLLSLRDASNETFTASAATVGASLIGMAVWRASVLAASWTIKDAIAEAEDKAALAEIDIDAGWPE